MPERASWWREPRYLVSIAVALVVGASIVWVLDEERRCEDAWPHKVESAVHRDPQGNFRTCYWLLQDISEQALVALAQPGANRPPIEDAIRRALACAAADDLVAPHDSHRDAVDRAYTAAVGGNWAQCAYELTEISQGVNHPH